MLSRKQHIVGVGFEPTVWKWERIAEGTEECKDLFGCVRHRHDDGFIAKIYHPWADREFGFDPGEYCRQAFQSIKKTK